MFNGRFLFPLQQEVFEYEYFNRIYPRLSCNLPTMNLRRTGCLLRIHSNYIQSVICVYLIVKKVIVLLCIQDLYCIYQLRCFFFFSKVTPSHVIIILIIINENYFFWSRQIFYFPWSCIFKFTIAIRNDIIHLFPILFPNFLRNDTIFQYF